jgi:hypothetical protein
MLLFIVSHNGTPCEIIVKMFFIAMLQSRIISMLRLREKNEAAPAVVEVLGPLSNKYAVSVPATSHFFIACTYQLYFSF